MYNPRLGPLEAAGILVCQKYKSCLSVSINLKIDEKILLGSSFNITRTKKNFSKRTLSFEFVLQSYVSNLF